MKICDRNKSIMMCMKELQPSFMFVLRRAWLMGLCARSDVDRAFATHTSPARASKIMSDAVAADGAGVFWKKRVGVIPHPRAVCPDFASASSILDALALGAPPSVTGLFPDDDIGFLMPHVRRSHALTKQATQLVVACAARNEPLEILYVGLRRNESAKWRAIWPCAMEFTGSHWRVHAHDLDTDQATPPVKVFVLSRVMDARPTDVKLVKKALPKNFVRHTAIKTDKRIKVHLNESLTADQVNVIRHGYGIDGGGVMTWPEHSLYEFKREHGDMPPNEHIVWPLMSRIDSVE